MTDETCTGIIEDQQATRYLIRFVLKNMVLNPYSGTTGCSRDEKSYFSFKIKLD